MDLKDKVVLITGSAKRLGYAIAQAFASNGCHVIIHYFQSVQESHQAVKQIEKNGGTATAIKADLNDPDDITFLFSFIKKNYSSLDILINNASSFIQKSFFDISLNDFESTFNINLRAPFLCVQAACKLMNRHGASPSLILNIADNSGITPWKGYALHSISKAGLIHLTKSIAKEFAPYIRANTIIPGYILPSSTFSKNQLDTLAKKKTLLQRTGSSTEIASFIIAVANNDYINGASLHIDGGYLST